MQRGLFPALYDNTDVGEQNDVHHQRIDDGGNGDDTIVEDKWAGGYGYGLCCVLHAHLDDDCALLTCF